MYVFRKMSFKKAFLNLLIFQWKLFYYYDRIKTRGDEQGYNNGNMDYKIKFVGGFIIWIEKI